MSCIKEIRRYATLAKEITEQDWSILGLKDAGTSDGLRISSRLRDKKSKRPSSLRNNNKKISDTEKVKDSGKNSTGSKVASQNKSKNQQVGGTKRSSKVPAVVAKTVPKGSTTVTSYANNDICYLCNDGGELLICLAGTDSKPLGCEKSFHPACVGRSKIPDGK